MVILFPFKAGSLGICDVFCVLVAEGSTCEGLINRQAQRDPYRIILPFSKSIRSPAKGVSLLCCGCVQGVFGQPFVGVVSLHQEADCSLLFPLA